MAKVSAVNKNEKRKRMAINQEASRKALKDIANDETKSFEERFNAMVKLSEKPRNSSKVRYKNRCKYYGEGKNGIEDIMEELTEEMERRYKVLRKNKDKRYKSIFLIIEELASFNPKLDKEFYNNEDNEGHFKVKLINHGDKDFEVKIGDRIAQGIFMKFLTVDNEEKITNVRTGGLGSTDKGGN